MPATEATRLQMSEQSQSRLAPTVSRVCVVQSLGLALPRETLVPGDLDAAAAVWHTRMVHG